MRGAMVRLMSACLLAYPTVAWGDAPTLAVRADGYLGYGNLELGNVDSDAFQGGGSASASAVFDQLYLQLDVFGDRADFEFDNPGSNVELAAKSVGAGGRIGWRNAELGSLGIVGTYDYLKLESSENDIGRIGLEGEIFLGPVTLGLNGGDVEIEDSSSGYLDGSVAFYPTDRLRFNVSAGALALEENDQTVVAGAGGEVLILDVLSAFVRWEGAFTDSFIDVDQHSVVFGARVYWGAETPSLVAYDRQHFKRSCAGFLLVGRIC